MVKLRPYLLLLAVVALALVIAGCPKPPQEADSPEAGEAGIPGGPGGDAAPAAPADTDEPADVGAALDADAVKGFMASMEDDAVEKVMDEIVDGLGVEDEDSPEAIKAALEIAAESDELAEAVEAHGFDSAAQWADTAKRVLPAMGIAMGKVMAEALGVEEGTPEYDGMMESGDDEFAELDTVFGEPSEEDIAVVMDVLKESMEDEGAGDSPEDDAPEEEPTE